MLILLFYEDYASKIHYSNILFLCHCRAPCDFETKFLGTYSVDCVVDESFVSIAGSET